MGINMFLGVLWYGPLFGNVWLRMIDKKADEIEGGSNPLTYLVPMVGAFVGALVLALLIANMRIINPLIGAGWGALIWFAFGGVALLTTSNFEERKPGLSWLFISYMLVVHLINGALFVIWI
jgi:hypothetical protein